MIWKSLLLARVAVVVGLSVCLVALAPDASAQRRGGGARPRASVSRQGPAQSGSFHSYSNRAQGDARSDQRRDARPERMEPHRGPDRERRRAPEMRERRQDYTRDARDGRDDRNDRRDDRYEERRDPPPERVQERRENRRDYYDDRRDDRRDFARGTRYSTVWWTSNSCARTVFVVVDGYSYYQCDGTWFGRTYYGGEVTYTVIDAPQGY